MAQFVRCINYQPAIHLEGSKSSIPIYTVTDRVIRQDGEVFEMESKSVA